MKKFGLFLVLFFAYFVCVADVYAVAPDGRCSIIDNQSEPGFVYFSDCSFDGTVTGNILYRQSGPSPAQSYTVTEPTVLDYSNGSLVYGNQLFGLYNGSGNTIPYVRPPNADNWNLDKFKFVDHTYYYTDNSTGNIEVWNIFNQVRTIDLNFGNIMSVGKTSRLDVAVHFNLTDTPEKFRPLILDSFDVSVFMPNGSNQSYCTSVHKNDILNITCSFIAESTSPVIRIESNLSENYLFASEYNYKIYLDVSNYSYVWGPSDTPFSEDFNNIESPNGDFFNDNYSKLQDVSNSFFSNFQNPNFNGLTTVVMAPLNLIRNLNSETSQPLSISIFGKNIVLENGNYLFWNTRAFNTVHVGSYTCDRWCQLSLRNNFQAFWSTFWGCLIVYLTAKKLFKVCMNLYDPNNSSVEVF